MMEYPKKKDLNNRAEQTSTFTNDRSFNDAISLMSAEIRRRCDVDTIARILMEFQTHELIVRDIAIHALAKAICKHFEEGLGD